MLTVRGLQVRYGDLTALDGVDLDLAGDETVAVLGASGSGKSTLLRAVAGLAPVTTGTIHWDGADLAGVPPHLRRFGLVFQDFALFPHLDVAGNVGFGLRMAGASGAEVRRTVDAVLARVDLGGLGTRRVDELSGGQAQRVALARTLAAAPRMLLLDEPLGSLDPALRRDLATDLAATLADEPVPTLLVTHDVDEAFALADRIAVLDQGRIVRSGTAGELWRDPRAEAVARLLGHAVVRTPFAGISPPAGGSLAVRPEALREDPDGALAAVVVASAFRGPGYETTLTRDGARLTASSPGPHRIGDTIRFAIDPTAITPLPD